MRIRRPVNVLPILAVISSLAFGFSSASAAQSLPNPKVDASTFWTAERINKAIAFDMVFQKGAKSAVRVPVLKGAAKPSGGSTTSVLGASWNSLGLPLTASGKVFFAIGTGLYQCSGALVRDGLTDRSIVLTAGHCIYDNASQKYVTSWIFIPSYDVNRVSASGCSTSTNCWPADNLFAHSGFTGQTSFSSTATLYDWGFAKITTLKNSKLPDGGDGTTLDGTNSFPFSFNNFASGTQVSSFGYPAAGKYNGTDLVYSSGKLSFDSSNGNNTYKLASDMTGGCSGGPWLSGMQTSGQYSGTLSSVNSYKYGTTTFIYGPKFNSATESTYSLAKTS